MTKFETDFINLVKRYGFKYTVDDRYIDVFINGDLLSSLFRVKGLIRSFTKFSVYKNLIMTCGTANETIEYTSLKDYEVLLNKMYQKYKELKYKQKLNRIKEDF